MTDGVIKGTGNSRYLKSVADFLTLYPDYQSFAQALIAGTLPIDLNGINSSGWSTVGTKLNKANLLTDSTATSIGLTSSATVDSAIAKLNDNTNLVDEKVRWIKLGSVTAGATSRSVTMHLTSIPAATRRKIIKYHLLCDKNPRETNISTGAVSEIHSTGYVKFIINGKTTDQYNNPNGYYDWFGYCSLNCEATIRHSSGGRAYCNTFGVNMDGAESSGFVSGYRTVFSFDVLDSINFSIRYNNSSDYKYDLGGATFFVYGLLK